MSRFAASTDVPVDRSQAEIQRTLLRYGASEFMFGQGTDQYYVAFCFKTRAIRIRISSPPKKVKDKTWRSQMIDNPRFQQDTRQRFRCLLLIIKAKLEAVESGIVSVEQEFMPYLIMPNGNTVSENWMPQMLDAFEKGNMPKSIFGDNGSKLLTEGKS